MDSGALSQLGWDSLSSTNLEGVLFTSSRFEKNPRFASEVNETLSIFNDLPSNLNHINDVLGDSLKDPATLARVVALSPALAGKVVKLVNSGQSALRGKVTNTRRAMSLVGFETVRGLLDQSSSFMKNGHNRLPDSIPLGELYCHSVAVSRIAGAISDAVGGLDSATLVTAGLLHDAGKLVIAALDKQRFAECLDESAEEDEDLLVELEVSKIGLSHPLLGAVLVRNWNCPERLWSTIAFQNHMERSPHPKMTAVLCLSEFIARANGFGSDGQKADVKTAEKAGKILGVPPERAPRLVDHLMLDEIMADCRTLLTWE